SGDDEQRGSQGGPARLRRAPAPAMEGKVMTLPLAGLRVLEMTDGRGAGCGRFLADLGADVVLVEPPGGARSRRAEPTFGGESLEFATWAANKRSVVLDLADVSERQKLLEMLA